MINRKKKVKVRKINSYKKYFLAIAFTILTSGLVIVVSSESIRAQISGLYNKQNDQVAGVTALMSAVVSYDIEGVRFFSKGGKSLINQKNLGGATALHLACRNKDLEIVKILLENGADVNALDNESWSPLMRAALAGSPEIVNILLDNGAKANYVNSVSESAIYHAVLSNCNNCLTAMVNKFNFVKETDPEVLKKEISDAFVIASNHDNKDAQLVLNNLLDLVNKMQVLNSQSEQETKIFSLKVKGKNLKKFTVKAGPAAKNAANIKAMPASKQVIDVNDVLQVEDDIAPKQATSNNNSLDKKFKFVKGQDKTSSKSVKVQKQEVAPIAQPKAVPDSKLDDTIVKPLAEPASNPVLEPKKPLNSASVYIPLDVQDQSSKTKVFKFMKEAAGSKKETTNNVVE